MLALAGYPGDALLWAIASAIMILLTYSYARLAAPAGITAANVFSYLRGHIIVTCLTGAVWSGFAIYLFDPASEFRIFISVLLVLSITLGGMLPSSAYRPGYVGLAVCTLVPFGLYVLAMAPWPMRLLGLGTLVYFAFGMFTSARAEFNTREAISGRRTQDLMAQVVEQNETIQKVHEEKTRFLAATSHDLSQPLHAQGYFIQVLREKLSEPSALEFLAKIENSWRSQIELIEGLVEINRLDSGSVVPQAKAVLLQDELPALLDEFTPIASQKGIHFNSDVADIAVITDPVLFMRIVRNLVSNAIKYTHKGGRVDLVVRQDCSNARIEINDNGPGMEQEDHARVFDEYVRLERDLTTASGLGLGLSIVRRLSRLLELELSFSSRPGHGTSFNLVLPGEPAIRKALKANEQPQQALRGSPLVVLVDDDKSIRAAMTELLSLWGCQVLASGSAEEIMTILGQTDQSPTLLIVDWKLGYDADGLNLIESLRQEVNEETPAILMSATVFPSEMIDEHDTIRFLSKPVEPQVIRQILHSVAR
ncbi:hybrid sensor histidine kinase/response regulator [uncultured Hoeflea sp.]|uniref:ATP-binding response regulator n=1 Tax=uncultured Hoeflea sp. TaxID=538666 RepID=UPI0030D92497